MKSLQLHAAKHTSYNNTLLIFKTEIRLSAFDMADRGDNRGVASSRRHRRVDDTLPDTDLEARQSVYMGQFYSH